MGFKRNELIAQAAAAGDVLVDKIDGAANYGEFEGLVEGDVIKMPNSFAKTIPGADGIDQPNPHAVRKHTTGRFKGANYVIVDLVSGDSVRLYPTMFRKNRILAHEEEGKVVLEMEGGRAKRIYTRGSAVDAFKSHSNASAQDQLDSLRGRYVKVSKVSNTYEVAPFRGQTGVQTTSFYELNFCDENGQNEEVSNVNLW